MIGLRRGRSRLALPLQRGYGGRLLPWLVGLFVYVAGLSAAGLLVVSDTVDAAEASLHASMTLQVPAEASQPRLATILALLRQTQGIVAAHVVGPAELARLLEPWLGPAVKLDELPVPRLIEIRVDPNGPADVTGLRQHLASVVPQARLDDHRAWLAAMHGGARRLDAVLSAAVAAALLLTAVSAAAVARISVATQRPVIELLQLLGACDGDIAGPIALRLLNAGLTGGAVGAALTVLSVAALGGAGAVARLPAPVMAIGVADWRLWSVAVGTALAAGLITLAGARLTVLRQLARMP